MARLPTPGGDSGNWGTILNTFLSQVHASDGTLKTDSVTSDAIAPNAVTTAAIAPAAITVETLAPNTIDDTVIADGSITETLLDTALQTKINGKANNAITISGGTSLTGGGDLTTNRTLTLVNDAANPGNSKYYGTDGTGTKGYFSLPSGLTTFTDDTFTVQDNLDNTKQLQLQLSGITTGTIRTLTVPDASTTLVGTDTAQTMTNKTLTTPKIDTIKDTYGNTSLLLSATASAVNYIQLNNNATANSPYFVSAGSDTNIGLILFSKGTGTVSLRSNINGKLLDATPVTSGVNYIQLSNAATGAGPIIQATGTDTNVSLNLTTQGSGIVQANGLEVATISGTQTLTNKTISGSSNTLSNIALSSLDATSYATAATASTLAQRDANANLTADNFMRTVDSTVTSGGTTSLTIDSAGVQVFTGTSAHTVQLPSTGVKSGMQWTIINQSTGVITIQSSSGGNLWASAQGRIGTYTATQDTPTSASHWSGVSSTAGKTSYTLASLAFTGTDHTTFTFPSTSDTVASLNATQTLTNKTLTGPAISDPTLSGTSKIVQSGAVEIYNTADETTNYEKLVTRYTSNVAEIGTLFGGSASTRAMRLGVGGTADLNSFSRAFTIQSGVTPFYQTSFSTSATGSMFDVAGQLASASGTQTMLAVDPTVLQSGTASYTALLINPTESTTGSGTKLLIDAQVGGVSKFSVDNTGVVTMAAVGTGAGSVVTTDGTQTLTNKTITGPILTGASIMPTGWSATSYNTADQVTNYERVASFWSGNSFYLAAATYSGTGVRRTIRIDSGGSLIVAGAANYTGTISATVSTGTPGGVQYGVLGTLSASSGIQYITALTPTINQSGTAGYTTLFINPTETSTGSGTKLLIDARVGGTSKFSVDSTGNISSTGTLTLNGASVLTGVSLNSGKQPNNLYMIRRGTRTSWISGLHNDLAYLVERGGAVTCTLNGVDQGDKSNLFRGATQFLTVNATSDEYVLEITLPTIDMPYNDAYTLGCHSYGVLPKMSKSKYIEAQHGRMSTK